MLIQLGSGFNSSVDQRTDNGPGNNMPKISIGIIVQNRVITQAGIG